MEGGTEKQRVLIVDDSSFNISILGSALSEEYEVSVATNGRDAIAVAEAEPHPDLILLDIIMPGMDGHQVCRELKSRSTTQGIPIIFITAMNQEGDEMRGLELGAVDYITKPFSIPIVRARVRTHLDLKRKTDILEHLSSLDGLTGIPNRRRFDEVLDLEWRRLQRTGSPLSVVMLDIDFFKKFNDHYGHAAGDGCLRHVAGALRATLKRPHDFVARYGGEEFVAVLPDTDFDGAVRIAQTMREAIESLGLMHEHSDVTNHVTVSVGVCTTIPGKEKHSEDLLTTADRMLYRAKDGGRNRVEGMSLP
ncbi:diguanylate cyclase (GGDEF)-like protein [Desulfobaculum xiamenense]|uniref:diguanylate cyclase n=1 Tax=Desulfobaculum xiamenense TaxID=995050 RepID=A0A846QSE0_9BACT|nr:PleD family two-component system response regulator [Desulfobaculum xiamenense]NJB68355.1 diguanylate cyclase (GGDEF)-like protein [Desulfobaculum xiamenense]